MPPTKCLQVRATFSGFTSKFKSVQGITLDVANKIYLKDGNYELTTQINDDAIKVFDAGLEKIDFGKSHAAANTINSWASIVPVHYYIVNN